MILEKPAPPLASKFGCTAAYEDLVHRLLVKDPGGRLDWDGLHAHPVWRSACVKDVQ